MSSLDARAHRAAPGRLVAAAAGAEPRVHLLPCTPSGDAPPVA
ncbi:hypothetical protein [Streptomyces sp. NPDC051310]